MAKGILNIQAADGAVIGLHVPDGLTSGERQIALGTNLSGITAYHLLQGNLAVSASTITQGFNTTLYTGNGGTQSINTGIDMSTQWGSTAEEKFGGLVWIKSRTGTQNNAFTDTIRGNTKIIQSNTTNAESVSSTLITSFNNNGISLGSDNTVNGAYNYASWNFQTTHRVTGTTNHGQAYTCHYNPFTGFTMVKYTGSGLAGHEIPHMLGRKLGFATIKNLTSVADWVTFAFSEGKYAQLNLTTAFATASETTNENSVLLTGAGVTNNTASNTYIMYGWANSYFDKANKLIGNYEIGVYQGTGASGNKVPTRGKPAWLMIKRLDSTGNWVVFDNMRGSGNSRLFPNLSNSEGFLGDYPSNYSVRFDSDGMTFAFDDWWSNASGGQYLYMVAYDTNANGSGSYYPLASDTANVQVNNALIPIAQGIDSNGAKNTILSKNETFSGLTYTQGKNYPYYDALGNRGVSNKTPNYGTTNPANGGDFYNVSSNKWYTSAGVEITNGRNYLNHIVYADNDGGVLYVEELPKIEYKDVVKANEYRGKNACTAWALIDGGGSVPKILDGININAVIRTATAGVFKIYQNKVDNTNYGVSITRQGADTSQTTTASEVSSGTGASQKTLESFTIALRVSAGSAYDQLTDGIFYVEVKGGKN